MSTQILHAAPDPALDRASIRPASRYLCDSREALLALGIEELAVLRFSVILTARWQASDSESRERRAELKNELELLRKHYGDKIDEIALAFGVTAAMNAKEDVERSVIVPRDARMIGELSCRRQEQGAGADCDSES